MSEKTLQLSSKKTEIVSAVSLIGFILALHVALQAYITSTFLSRFSTELLVGVAYTIASLATVVMFSLLPYLLRRYGNYRITLILLWIEGLALLCLAFLGAPAILFLAFGISFVVNALLGLNFDIFLEHASSDTVTGEIRGMYLVFINMAWVAGQIAVSLILTDGEYWKIFFAASLLIIPAIFLTKKYFSSFKDPQYKNVPMFGTLAVLKENKDIRGIYTANFLLHFFFSWMVIYTPLYLYNYIGFDWKTISVMFAIMLLPFVITEWPLGKIADRLVGEKEILIAGFIVMAISTAVIPFLASKNFILWTAVLFISRIGASMVEIMSETYFFKQVKDRDVSLIGLFRTTRPWAYVIAPFLATLLLPFFGVQYLFLALGFIMLCGALSAVALRDTR